MKNSRTIVSINGKITSAKRARISVFDEGLMLGSGQFETLLAIGNRPIWLAEHLARMEKTRRFFGHPKVYSQKQIAQFVTEAVRAHPNQSKAVRLFRTAGAGARWGGAGSDDDRGSVIVIVAPHTFPNITKGQSAYLTQSPLSDGWQSRHKTLSWLAHTFPRAGAATKRDPGGLDLFFSPNSGVTEFASAAILIRKGARVYTPPETHILPSVTRLKALRILKRKTCPFKLRIKRLEPADIFSADEIIGLSSTRLVFPIGLLANSVSKTPKSKRYSDFTLAAHLRAAFERSLKFQA
jgi:branched-subunit amino acid aminotransferase/4-amino-4-deoxychorismate lyase